MDQEQKRFYILAFGIVIGAIIIVVLFLSLTGNSDGEKKGSGSITLSDEDVESIELVSTKFLNESGTWGVNKDTVTGDSINEAASSITLNDKDASRFWNSRSDVYEKVKEKYISPDSVIWYGNRITAPWYDETARQSLASFSVSDISFDDPIGSVIASENSEIRTATINTTLKSTVTLRYKGANDTSWDGTYDVRQKIFNYNATISLIEENGEWVINDIRDANEQFLFVTLKDIPLEYSEKLANAAKIGSIQSDYTRSEGVDGE